MENKKFEELIKKVEAMKKSGSVDLSTEEDLSLAIMNLISLEEHFFFTGEKTGNADYFDFMDEVRALRKELLAKMIDKHEGETWCISKHLLATTMRLMEVGTKLYSDGKKEEAKDIFDKSYKTYSLFWAVRLKLLDVRGFSAKGGSASGGKQIAADKKPWTYSDIVDKLVDCCDE
ncbi:MAG: hypothetical protein Q7K44_00805 [Candidatus Liptonbacteria bacterium]|nr:hypothetical protein [Candidatus Liptonbacteria bacterium]